MADYSRRSRTIRRVEFVVPTPWPVGACFAEISKAVSAVQHELGGRWRGDDSVRVKAGDDEIVVYYDEETGEDIPAGEGRIVTGELG